MTVAGREMSRFIAAGRLHCKIDKVGGIVETTRPDSKNWQYQASEPCTSAVGLKKELGSM